MIDEKLPFKKYKIGLNIIFLVIICCFCAFAKIKSVGSDPYGTLLVSQQISQSGTIKLDSYENILPKYSYKIQKKNGHYYYYFPLGTSVFAVPAVAAANLLGYDMLRYEPRLQYMLAAAVACAIYLFMVGIARLYLPSLQSECVALLFWLGTSYSSTGATALWSHDFGVLFATAAIYLLLLAKFLGQRKTYVLIGFCLFAAYFCRPTLSLFVPIYLLALFTISRVLAAKVAFFMALFMAAFVAFSIKEFNQILPDYYLPQRLSGGHFWVALYGNLLSPARGLLIYSTFLAIPMIWAASSRKNWVQHKPEMILLLWPVLHLIAISRFPHWWGGYSFGARLMMDVLPALYVLLLCFLAEIPVRLMSRWGLTAGLGLAAIWINAYQGLFNQSTAEWNAAPSIDEFPQYLFDWKYPQFLSTPERLTRRMMEHEANLQKH